MKRKEDYFVMATLYVGECEYHDIPCKVYLPERIEQKPRFVFKPTDEIMRFASYAHKGELKATVFREGDCTDTVIESPEVYFADASTTYWGNNLTESNLSGDPQDLRITKYITPPTEKTKTNVVFWISPNSFLAPRMVSTSSYTGELQLRRVRSLRYPLKDDLILEFDYHFKSKNDENGDFVQWQFLVACADLDISSDDVESINDKIIPHIDDLLLLSSFAARQRTACMGWTATNNKAHTTFFRGNYVFPEKSEESDNHYGVIDVRYMEQFIAVCYPAFVDYENKLAIRNAIYSAVPFKPETITTSFLNTFAGLETLVSDYRKTNKLEHVLANGVFRKLSHQIKDCINNSTNPALMRNEVESIVRKLPELNRISLREAFDKFCLEYELDLSDLWPVFKDAEGIGLSEVRNKLIHGDPYPEKLNGAISTALDHLKFILERAIVRLLSWNIEDSLVGPNDIGRFRTDFDNWRSDQKEISDYMR